MTERKSLYCKSNPGNASFLFGVGGTTISSPHPTITLSVQRPDGIPGGEMEGMQCFWIAQIHNLGRALPPSLSQFLFSIAHNPQGEKIGLTKVAVEILLHSMKDQKLHLREFRWFFFKKREENESHQALVYLGTSLQILVLILFWGYIHLLLTCYEKKRRNNVSTKKC